MRSNRREQHISDALIEALSQGPGVLQAALSK
jgi:hypothetical protein